VRQLELFEADERAAFQPVEPLRIYEWAPQFVQITEGPLIGQHGTSVAWSADTFPLQTTPMRALDDPRWSRVCLLTAPQAFGKTLSTAVPTLLHGVQHRQVPVMYVAGNADLANSQWKTKIKPAMLASPKLRSLIPDNTDLAGNRLQRDFTNGTCMHTVGSESIGNLSAKTSPVIICDDVQAYGTLPKLGHPADYAATRTGSYPLDAITMVYIGTATTQEDWLWQAMAASALFVPFLPCPKCGTYQMIEFDRFVFEPDPNAAIAETWMRCANAKCDRRITFDDLPAILTRHVWASMPPDEQWVTQPTEGGVTIDRDTADLYPNTSRPTHAAGFWCNAFYWPWGRTWGEWAAEWLLRAGNPDSRQDFQQNVQVIPWVEPSADEDAMTAEEIAGHAVTGHHWKTVPADAGVQDGDGAVVVTADVQAGYVWYLVQAWQRSNGRSWVIEAGKFGRKLESITRELPTKRDRTELYKSRVMQALEGLWRKESDGWPIVAPTGELVGTAHASWCLIDCGYLRETVQMFCKLRNGGQARGKWLPVEGSQAKARGKAPVWPGTTRPTREKKTRRLYWECNTNRAKLWVRDILAIPPGEPGSMALPNDMPAKIRDWYCKHLCAEEWDAGRGTWKVVSRENHLLDAEAMQMAGCLAADVRLPVIAESEHQPEPVTNWFAQQKGRGRRRK